MSDSVHRARAVALSIAPDFGHVTGAEWSCCGVMSECPETGREECCGRVVVDTHHPDTIAAMRAELERLGEPTHEGDLLAAVLLRVYSLRGPERVWTKRTPKKK